MANSDVLNSWKEVAAYLGRGVRTVQRWERELALPVRRPRGKSRSAVIAFRAELDIWLSHSWLNGDRAVEPAVVSPELSPVQLPVDNQGRKHGHLHDQTSILIGKTHQLLSRSNDLCQRSRFLSIEVSRMVVRATTTLGRAAKGPQNGEKKDKAVEIAADEQPA
jgi:hypothetical protein